MMKQAALSQSPLQAPVLYLSSLDAGWDGLLAQAFYEPDELEGWISPNTSDVSLIVFSGGGLHIEQRQSNGPWKATDIQDSQLLLRPGTGEASEIRWKSLSATPTQTLHLHLSKRFMASMAGEVSDHDSARLRIDAKSGFHDPLLAQIGLALWRELAEGSPSGKLYAQTAAQLIAVHLLRHYASIGTKPEPQIRRLTPRQLKRVTDFVREHPGQALALDDLAAQAGFSPYHFARLFRQTMGESPHQFVLRGRVETAQKLLRETDLPLATIALEAGFANQSHLTRTFRRLVGVTPRAYRFRV